MESSREENLERFKRTDLAKEFVLEHHGEWNHQDWLKFCALVESKGFTPIDWDQVGLTLEAKKTDYLNGNL